MAVAFFFVLGGFSMTLGYKDKVLQPNFDYKQYLTRRCIKFYPLHWLCLLAAVPLALQSFNKLIIPAFFANIALLHTWIPIRSIYFSFNLVSWYLADTIFFAIMFPFIIKMIVYNHRRRAIIAFLIAGVYFAVAMFIPDNLFHAIFYISPYMRLTDFIFGIYLALLFQWIVDNNRKLEIGSILGFLVCIFIIVLLVVESCLLPEKVTFLAPVYWPLVASLIILASLLSKNNSCRLLECKLFQLLGEYSFVIFMTHQIVLRYFTRLFKVLNVENNGLYIVSTFLITLVLSVLVKKYFLKPVTQWLTKRVQLSTIARS